MKFFRLIRPQVIKVMGVGRGGIDAVNHLYQQGVTGVEFFIFDTDAGALEVSPVPNKVQLGTNLCGDVNVGSIPKFSKTAPIENIEDIKCVLEAHTKLLLIITGLTGNTGTMAGSVIAKAARQLDILTIGIVTMPFLFRGHNGMIQADDGLSAFKKQADSFLVISNRGIRLGPAKLSSSAYSGQAYQILTAAVKGIAGIVTSRGYNNVGLKDVRKAMKDSGNFLAGYGEAEGKYREAIAADAALSIPYFNEHRMEDAKSILLNISAGNKKVTMDEIAIITSQLNFEFKWDTSIEWCNSKDKTLGEKLSVTIIATRFQTRNGHTNPHLLDGEYKTIDRDRPGMDHSVPGTPGQGPEEHTETLFEKGTRKRC
jgi:cell division protein FtsZ